MKISQINRSKQSKVAFDRLKGRIAVISGGANGVGAAASRMFAREGAAVVILDWDRAGGEAFWSLAPFFLECWKEDTGR
jgi:predicted oxidoreductase